MLILSNPTVISYSTAFYKLWISENRPDVRHFWRVHELPWEKKNTEISFSELNDFWAYWNPDELNFEPQSKEKCTIAIFGNAKSDFLIEKKKWYFFLERNKKNAFFFYLNFSNKMIWFFYFFQNFDFEIE